MRSNCRETSLFERKIKMKFDFDFYDEKNVRSDPTTQVAIRVAEWPGNTFLLWLPEDVNPIWNQWTEGISPHQDFERTDEGGLVWRYETDEAMVEAKLTPEEASLLCEVYVKNLSGKSLKRVGVQNCFHLSKAGDFACRDGSRIFIRVDGRWRSLADLKPKYKAALYLRKGYADADDLWAFADNKPPKWATDLLEEPLADHPLIVCLSKDGGRAVGAASNDYRRVFHNGGLEYLLCVHSQQAVLPELEAGGNFTFRQKIYFADGGLRECIRVFEEDASGGGIRP